MIYPVTVTITIETEVEANNPLDAEQIAFNEIADEYGQLYPIDVTVHDPTFNELNPGSDFFTPSPLEDYDVDNFYYDYDED